MCRGAFSIYIPYYRPLTQQVEEEVPVMNLCSGVELQTPTVSAAKQHVNDLWTVSHRK